MVEVDEWSHAERGCRVRKSRTMLRPPKNTILMTRYWTRSYEALLRTYENCIGRTSKLLQSGTSGA